MLFPIPPSFPGPWVFLIKIKALPDWLLRFPGSSTSPAFLWLFPSTVLPPFFDFHNSTCSSNSWLCLLIPHWWRYCPRHLQISVLPGAGALWTTWMRQTKVCHKNEMITRCVTRIWRRQWHPTPVLLPGKSHGWRSLVGCSPWGREESDVTKRLHFHFSLSCIGEGNGNPLQRSCLENPRDGGAWWAAVYGVAQSQTRLKWLSSSSDKDKCSCCWTWDFVPQCSQAK